MGKNIWDEGYSYLDDKDEHDFEDYVEKLEREAEERDDWLQTLHAEPGDPDYDEFDSLISVEEYIKEHRDELTRDEIRALKAEYGIFDDEDEDEYDEDEYNEDEIDCQSNENSGVTLSFSFSEPPRTKPNNGFWKYYDETWDIWYYKKALMDEFPDLKNNYDYEEDSDCDVFEILTETYDLDPKRALSYSEWIMGYFPPNEIQKTKRGGERIRACTLSFFTYKL